MAERIPPGFNIPLGFYDGPEVRSIPRRIRAQAVGVFALAGNYSATRLSDGYVDAETLAEFGCGPAIRAALMNTLGKGGAPDPLWIEAPANGIQFAKWSKWQRTAGEVTAYRESEAERKRVARAAKKQKRIPNALGMHSESTSNALPMQSNQTQNAFDDKPARPVGTQKCPADVRRTSGQSETETETESLSTYVDHASSRNVDPAAEERGRDAGRSAPVDPSASRLVATLVPANIPAAVKTSLRLGASQLMVGDQLSADVVAESLRRWTAKPNAGPGLLPHIASEVVRENAQLATNGGRPPGPPNKLRSIAELAARERAAENDRNATARKEILP